MPHGHERNHTFYHFSQHWNGDSMNVAQYYQKNFLLDLQSMHQLLVQHLHLQIEMERSLQTKRMELGKNKGGLFPTIHYILNKLPERFLLYQTQRRVVTEKVFFVDEASYHLLNEIHFEC